MTPAGLWPIGSLREQAKAYREEAHEARSRKLRATEPLIRNWYQGREDYLIGSAVACERMAEVGS